MPRSEAHSHTCDRKGPPAKIIDESGDEPITRSFPTCSVCGVPQVFGTRAERIVDRLTALPPELRELITRLIDRCATITRSNR